MKSLSWYWRRLRAMSPLEMAAHARRQWWHRTTHWQPDGHNPGPGRHSLRLPDPASAPAELRSALVSDTDRILAGKWRAFGHLELAVDNPPKWHRDYLAGIDLPTSLPGYRLNYRRLDGGADIKLIWELSRWYTVTRLAMAAYVLGHEAAGQQCLEWLEDWERNNKPFYGWNWTSALESGMRLVQFAWIDALLSAAPLDSKNRSRLEVLRARLLGPHVIYTWRFRSFGSSANNHLLGELAGLILACARWPELDRYCAPLSDLQQRWEQAVLAQFAEDGGNREQALNYQLFAWEFCWHSKMALESTGRPVSPNVVECLIRAGAFFREVQVPVDGWDYGDSDNAYVLPLFSEERDEVAEWWQWLGGEPAGSGIAFWLGPYPSRSDNPAGSALAKTVGDWRIYPASGIAIGRRRAWRLRWDLSPLGYLATAAHGHADAQHLSLWYDNVAFIIDPGTGAYYAEPELRRWLASRAAHNGPCPTGMEFLRRGGPFLWSTHHPPPGWRAGEKYGSMQSELAMPFGRLFRTITPLPDNDGWEVADAFAPYASNVGQFTVHWQCAPGSTIQELKPRHFKIASRGKAVELQVGQEWITAVAAKTPASDIPADRLAGVVSSAFRQQAWAPYVKLTASGGKACVFRTIFLASTLHEH